MKKLFSRMAVVAVLALAVGVVAIPAHAAPPGEAGVVVFTGVANVTPLQFPVVGPSNLQGNYGFASANLVGGQPANCVKVGVGGQATCAINVNGNLASVAGIGAACGVSHGYGGTGGLTSSNGSTYSVSNVGWVTSAGGTLPVTGTYKITGGGKNKGAGHVGPIAGVVQAQGGAACTTGAATFNVVGLIAVL